LKEYQKAEGINGLPAEILRVDLKAICWPQPRCIEDSGRRKTPVWNNNLARKKSKLIHDFNHRHQDREHDSIWRDYKKSTR
jgi:hypothetical protein